jgi:ABC-type spermidine/putrescine transport system permease subunit I
MKLRGVLALILVALVLVPSVVQPVVELVSGSVAGDGASRYAAILTRAVHLRALGRSLAISLLTVVAGAALGVPLAFLTRGAGRIGPWLARLALAPLFLSPVLGTLAFHFLFGDGGVIRHFFPGLVFEFRGFDASTPCSSCTF